MLSIFRAPLFWFLFMGAGLFVIDAYLSSESKNTIVITRGDVNKITDQWRAQSGKEITPAMLAALIQEQVQERRLYREALALNLDKDDVIIQRRLAQKLRFLNEDIVDEREISEENLVRYYRDHATRYVTSSTYTFQHIYFSAEDPKAKEKAAVTLVSLSEVNHEPWESLGSPFILGRYFKNQTSTTLKHQFGQEFMSALGVLELKKWIGPVESGYGLHLIYLEGFVPGHLPSYETLETQLLEDYRAANRKQSFEAFLDRLVEKYPVIIEAKEEN